MFIGFIKHFLTKIWMLFHKHNLFNDLIQVSLGLRLALKMNSGYLLRRKKKYKQIANEGREIINNFKY